MVQGHQASRPLSTSVPVCNCANEQTTANDSPDWLEMTTSSDWSSVLLPMAVNHLQMSWDNYERCWLVFCALGGSVIFKDSHLPWNERRKTCAVPMNLHGVGRSARPTSKWAPKAHHAIGKTRKGHCEWSSGTNVLVLAINTTTFSLCHNLLKGTSKKMSL